MEKELYKLQQNKPNAYLKILKQIFKSEIHSTVGNKNLSFNSFKNNINKYSKKPYIKKMLEFYDNPKYIKKTEEEKLHRIFCLYYGSINIFKPSVAYQICKKYKPETVLDPFAGWGSRAVGCSASGCNYIGIDNNNNLLDGYDKVKERTNLNFDIIISDCLKVDYSKYTYDMVLTSPPYYNTEIYSNTQRRTKKQWIEVYEQIFSITYKHLKNGGYFCMNVPTEIYDKILVKLLDDCDEKMLFYKSQRFHKNNTKSKTNDEYVYIWIKKDNIITKV